MPRRKRINRDKVRKAMRKCFKRKFNLWLISLVRRGIVSLEDVLEFKIKCILAEIKAIAGDKEEAIEDLKNAFKEFQMKIRRGVSVGGGED